MSKEMFATNHGSALIDSPILDAEVESANERCHVVKPRKAADGLELKLGGSALNNVNSGTAQASYSNPAKESTHPISLRSEPPAPGPLESPLRFGANNSAFRAIEPPKLGDEDQNRKDFSATPGPKGAFKTSIIAASKSRNLNRDSPVRLMTRTPSRGSSSYIIEGTGSGSKVRTPDQFHLFGSDSAYKRSPRNVPIDIAQPAQDILLGFAAAAGNDSINTINLSTQQKLEEPTQRSQLLSEVSLSSQQSLREHGHEIKTSKHELSRPKYSNYKANDLIAALHGQSNHQLNGASIQTNNAFNTFDGHSPANDSSALDATVNLAGFAGNYSTGLPAEDKAVLYQLGALRKNNEDSNLLHAQNPQSGDFLQPQQLDNKQTAAGIRSGDRFLSDYSSTAGLTDEHKLRASETSEYTDASYQNNTLGFGRHSKSYLVGDADPIPLYEDIVMGSDQQSNPAQLRSIPQALQMESYIRHGEYYQGMDINNRRNASSSFPPPMHASFIGDGVQKSSNRVDLAQTANQSFVQHQLYQEEALYRNAGFETASLPYATSANNNFGNKFQRTHPQMQYYLNARNGENRPISGHKSNHRYGKSDESSDEIQRAHHMTTSLIQPQQSSEGHLMPPHVDHSFEPSLPQGRVKEKNSAAGNSSFGRSSRESISSDQSWRGGYQSWPLAAQERDFPNGHMIADHSLPHWGVKNRKESTNRRWVNDAGSYDNMRSSKDSASNNSATMSSVNGALTSSTSSRPYSKNDFNESQQSKAAYKEFSRQFREYLDKESIIAAKRFAFRYLEGLPEDSAQWRIYLELADLAKRENSIEEARHFFILACSAEPSANNGWVEWSKMEEEVGETERALSILETGLELCVANEALMSRVIKLEERLHRHREVREKLGSLKSKSLISLEKVWRSIMEGALFEARNGRVDVARKCFKFLRQNVSWYGPIYLEAFRLEEKESNDDRVRNIIDQGLQGLPRYGPLWFGLMRIEERLDCAQELRSWRKGRIPLLQNLSKVAEKAVGFISKELTWRVYFEFSQAQERAAEYAAIGIHQRKGTPLIICRNHLLNDARKSLVKSLLLCPSNLRWRVLIVGARLEIGVGRIAKARELLHRAFNEVPVKSKPSVYLECSRVEEFCGNVEVSKRILLMARNETKSEWKIYLEWILVEARNGCIEAALDASHEAVNRFPGTGRLWAVMIQLLHRLQYQISATLLANRFRSSLQYVKSARSSSGIKSSSDLSINKLLGRAFNSVPKSGEVWCERSRCVMNPLNLEGADLNRAQRSIEFAIQFTPQYGDTFIECLRLEMLCQVLLPRILVRLGLPVIAFLREYLMEDPESDIAALLSSHLGRASLIPQSNVLAKDAETADLPSSEEERSSRAKFILAANELSFDGFGDLRDAFTQVEIKSLRQRCINADPNYGSAWFHCRNHPNQVAAGVIEQAKHILVYELNFTQKLYTRAFVKYICDLCHRPLSHLSASERKKQEADIKSEYSAGSTSHVGKLTRFHQFITRRSAVYSDYMNVMTSGHANFPIKNPDNAGGDLLLPVALLDGSVYCGSDFVTGIIELNRSIFKQDLSVEVRRRNLFGSDQIVS